MSFEDRVERVRFSTAEAWPSVRHNSGIYERLDPASKPKRGRQAHATIKRKKACSIEQVWYRFHIQPRMYQ